MSDGNGADGNGTGVGDDASDAATPDDSAARAPGGDIDEPAGILLDPIASFGAGDRIDFSALFSGRTVSAATDVVHVVDTAAGTVIAAALGENGEFVDIVLLEGVHGIDVDDLIQDGSIVV